MPRYPDDVFQEVFARNDIINYVSQYVKLQKRGKDYMGLCPFHSEKSPSFHVSQEKQLFHCFGCGASGNLVQFVMKTENLDFSDAFKLLADRAGVTLPEENNSYDALKSDTRKRIYKMNKLAARFYYDTLTRSEIGRIGLKYFYDRGITQKTIIAYGLGYAPPGNDTIINYMCSQGYTDEQILEAGLAGKSENRMYDRFRDRVIFPIIDLRGNVIGFGGRIMGDKVDFKGNKVAKYLNSAQTPVFDKGYNLFSLNLAKNSKESNMILCEGYMDVISTYQAGVTNIVATLGTALTENQARLLMRYCSEIIICYDSDEAGQKAALRAIDIINSVGGKSRVMRLRGAKDPDEFIKAHGVEAFRAAVNKALPSTEYKLSRIKGQYDINNTEGKVKFIGDAAEALIGINDAVEVDAYIKRISDETEISKEAIYSEYKKKAAHQRSLNSLKKENYSRTGIVGNQTYQAHTFSDNEPVAVVQVNKTIIEAEKKLLNLICRGKKLYKSAAEQLSPDEFSSEVTKRAAAIIYNCWENDTQPDQAVILNEFSGKDIEDATSIFYNLEVYADEAMTVSELIRSIKTEKLNELISKETDPVKLKELLQKKISL